MNLKTAAILVIIIAVIVKIMYLMIYGPWW